MTPSIRSLVSNPILNLFGGSVTLLSAILPWTLVNGYPLYFAEQYYGVVIPIGIPLIIAGGFVSLVSRVGGLMTAIGIVAYMGTVFSCPLRCVVTEGPGMFLAIVGGGLSLAGKTWNLEFFLPRTA